MLVPTGFVLTFVLAQANAAPCVPPTGFSLHEVYRSSVTEAHYDVQAARLRDTDGDGDVDVDDRMMVVSSIEGGDVRITDPLTGGEDVIALGAWRLTHRIGNVDGRPGAEVVVISHPPYSYDDMLSVFGDGFSYHRVLGPDSTGIPPWLVDLRGDGQPEVLLGTHLYSQRGRRIARWGDEPDAYRSVAVDLDLDGVPDVLTGTEDDGGRLTPHGLSVCADKFGGSQYYKNFAAGNLDSDPLGEFVVQIGPVVGVCDTSGAPLAEFDLNPFIDNAGWDMVGLGDLHGDATPEIVVAAFSGLVVLGLGSATPTWSVAGGGTTTFALADFDADGKQEILVQKDNAVVLYDGDGTELSVYPTALGNSVGSGPAIADFDGDGLAEIAVGGTGALQILENADGGFAIPDANLGWIGKGHFPGVILADGSLDLGGGHWQDPAKNVWQGLAACEP